VVSNHCRHGAVKFPVPVRRGYRVVLDPSWQGQGGFQSLLVPERTVSTHCLVRDRGFPITVGTGQDGFKSLFGTGQDDIQSPSNQCCQRLSFPIPLINTGPVGSGQGGFQSLLGRHRLVSKISVVTGQDGPLSVTISFLDFTCPLS
jgi:hypothetical protein